MRRLKSISAAVILSASIAGPALAQEVYVYGPSPYAGPPEGPIFYRSYGQVDPDYLPPRNTDEYWNLRNHGFTGRSPSRVGGESPNLTPSGS